MTATADAVALSPPPPPPAPMPGAAPPTFTPPATPPTEPSKPNRRGLFGALAAAAVVAAAIVGFVVFGGSENEETPSSSGGNGATGQGEQLLVLMFEDFVDNDVQWEAQPQNGITRQPALNERYRFEITEQAPVNAFAVSVGGARSFTIEDQRVTTTATLVQKGGGGVLNSFGVTCRYTGQDGYYFLIGSSGRFAIEKLVGGGEPEFLANGTHVAIRPGRAQNIVEARCTGGDGGTRATLTLVVNDTVVETVTDDEPIVRGVGGLAVTGQPGLVVEFDDFTLTEVVPADEGGAGATG